MFLIYNDSKVPISIIKNRSLRLFYKRHLRIDKVRANIAQSTKLVYQVTLSIIFLWFFVLHLSSQRQIKYCFLWSLNAKFSSKSRNKCYLRNRSLPSVFLIISIFPFVALHQYRKK